jgi:orotidine-5'-phosphate decarboxylase
VSKSFKQNLSLAMEKNKSFLCVGLDTDINKIPSHLKDFGDPIFEFNKQIIDATKDLVCSYKPNLAFYAAFGTKGIESLIKTVDYIPSSIPVIIDAKVGDIGNTANMYAKFLYTELKADAVTVNPYMGFDSIEPFISEKGKGVFALCLTSNSGSKDFQYLECRGKSFYKNVMDKLIYFRNNGADELGAVVGATHPDELKELRETAEDMLFLIPGVGSQGGDTEKVCTASNAAAKLALINVSRAVIYAGNDEDFAKKANLAALSFKNEINKAAGL